MEVYVLLQDGIPSYTKVAFLCGGGRIPVMGFPVCSAVAGGGPCACGYLYRGAHRVPRVSTCGCMEWNDRVEVSPLCD